MTNEQTRAELLMAGGTPQAQPEWRFGQLMANLATTSRPLGGGRRLGS